MRPPLSGLIGTKARFQVYQVVYITLKAGTAPRPAAWILERSLDGVSYSPWQFFAENDAECRRRYGLPATHGKPYYKTDDEVICTIFYSKLYPLENGEVGMLRAIYYPLKDIKEWVLQVHISLTNGRPGSNTSSDVLRNFTLARYVQFRFQKIHKTDKDNGLRKKLFYSVRTISIGGQCVCNGHASKCTSNSVSGVSQRKRRLQRTEDLTAGVAFQMPICECEHHTCGKSCSECCPLYNQQPWRPGTLESAGICEPCQCFGHSTACRYNDEIAREKLSLNVKGQYRGGGECINCSVRHFRRIWQVSLACHNGVDAFRIIPPEWTARGAKRDGTDHSECSRTTRRLAFPATVIPLVPLVLACATTQNRERYACRPADARQNIGINRFVADGGIMPVQGGLRRSEMRQLRAGMDQLPRLRAVLLRSEGHTTRGKMHAAVQMQGNHQSLMSRMHMADLNDIPVRW